MVLRYFQALHSALIPTGTTLGLLAPPTGGDIRGNQRILYATMTQAGADIQRIRVDSPDWGARQLQLPPAGQDGAVAGMRTQYLEHPQLVNKNQTVNVNAAQNSGVNQTTIVILLYMEGDIPAAVMAAVAEVHDLFFSGIDTPTVFPSVATDSQRLEQEAGSVWWPIAAAGQSSGGSPRHQITYPEADGQGPQYPANDDVLQERMWTEVVPIQPVNNGDTVDWFASSAAGGVTADGWVRFVKGTATTIPTVRFAPPYGNMP